MLLAGSLLVLVVLNGIQRRWGAAMATDTLMRSRGPSSLARPTSHLADRPLAVDRGGPRLVRLVDPGAEPGTRAASGAGGLGGVFRRRSRLPRWAGVSDDPGNHGAGDGRQHDLRRGAGARSGAAEILGPGAGDGVVDLPFAVSPVVAGLMLVVLYGPEGWLGGVLGKAGFQVIYAVPGMILATLFVTVPFVVRELVPILRELGEEKRAGGLHARGGSLAHFLEHHAAVDSLGCGLRRNADGRAVAR